MLRAALDAGANFWNGGEFYGPETNNSLVLLEKYFARYPEDAERVVLSIKGGMLKPNKTFQPDSSPANVRRSALDCQAQLGGRKAVDLFELARQDRVTPWETTLDALTALRAEGVFAHVALSEVTAETVHRVAKHVPDVAAVEVELSLMCRDVLEDGVAAACAEHGIPLVAYSPMGRGLLTGALRSASDANPLLASWFPRFHPENLAENLKLVDALAAFAARKGCTPAQLAINWARCLSLRPGMPQTIVPIPGGTTVAKVVENTTVVDLTAADLDELDAICSQYTVHGDRYPPGLPGKS